LSNDLDYIGVPVVSSKPERKVSQNKPKLTKIKTKHNNAHVRNVVADPPGRVI